MARDEKVTHKIMSAIKSKDTEPELILRRAIWKLGLRYRVNMKNLPGKPDIVFTKAKIAVFCDGDFWHGHNWAIRGLGSLEEELKSYSPFWREKIVGNVERDKRHNETLEKDGWLVLRFWESEIRDDANMCAKRVQEAYNLRIGIDS